ncbi:MAG: hypothetical protein KF757_08860 [Phycisphaeraceae bacterium]|nr:hypothetical protein [Phycisphaeraceae bacterium]MCW5762864.1 hypothetical protein [Phycisphaeraceae bacterium]
MARQIWISGKYEDDRGKRQKPREVEAAFRSFVLSSGRDGLSPAQAYVCSGRRLIQRTMWGRRMQKFFWLSLVVVIVSLSALICALGVEEHVNGNTAWWQMAMAVCVAIVLITSVLLSSRIDRWQLRREFARFTKAEPACLVCGYELVGLAAEHDGCTVCPECGGAWRVEGMFAELRT